jgi:glycerol uptake facilitator-like aquaporin
MGPNMSRTSWIVIAVLVGVAVVVTVYAVDIAENAH